MGTTNHTTQQSQIRNSVNVARPVKMMSNSHAPSNNDIFCIYVLVGNPANGVTIHTALCYDFIPRRRLHSLQKVFETLRVLRNKFLVVPATFDYVFRNPCQEGKIAPDVRLHVLTGDLSSKEQTPHVTGYSKILQSEPRIGLTTMIRPPLRRISISDRMRRG